MVGGPLDITLKHLSLEFHLPFQQQLAKVYAETAVLFRGDLMETSFGGRRMKMGQGTPHCQLTVLPLALHAAMLAHLSTVSLLNSTMQAATTLSSATQKDYTTHTTVNCRRNTICITLQISVYVCTKVPSIR